MSAGDVADVPPGVVTVTSTGPAEEPAGLGTVIEVSLLTVYEAAGVPPKLTAVAPVNPVPVTVTLVPPSIVPIDGEMPVTVGAGGGVGVGVGVAVVVVVVVTVGVGVGGITDSGTMVLSET